MGMSAFCIYRITYLLDYPEELHELHSDYPLAPERISVKPEDLSPQQIQILQTLHAKRNGTSEFKVEESQPKLIPNLRSKEKYIVHYRNLKLYLSLGMKLKTIHRVLAFNQAPWLKKYIDFNTAKRASSRNEFEKDFFKLMNNSMFGKTMENLRNRRKVDFVSREESFRKIVAQPTFKSFTIFHDHLVAVERLKSELVLNRPIYVGLCVLDISKVLMYDFHYNYVKSKYPNDESKLLFTDTDSLVYKIRSENLYRDMLQDKELFDFSGYPKDHPCYSLANKKVIGKMKDELNGSLMREFVGLRAKMYSLEYENSAMTKAKGVKRYVIKKQLKHSDYRDCLFECREFLHQMNSIRSQRHVIYSMRQNKTTLSAYDDKRYILDDSITTLPYGHYKI